MQILTHPTKHNNAKHIASNDTFPLHEVKESVQEFFSLRLRGHIVEL